MKTIAVIGAGNGGQAIAGHLALKGFDVRLYSTNQDKIKTINSNGFINLRGTVNGHGTINFASSDLKKVITGANIIMLCLPSIYHEEVELKMIPCLEEGQVVFIVPEASCGALHFNYLLKQNNFNKSIIIGAAATLPYTCRAVSDGDINVICEKKEVKIAALPAKDNGLLLDSLKDLYPSFAICSSVLETSLDNINAFVHPAPVLLNVSRIEAIPKQRYQYYLDGLTPSIAKLLEGMDKERQLISQSLGVPYRSLRQEFIDMYYGGVDKNLSLYELIHNNEGYVGIMNVNSVNERYTSEDVPYSLVSIQSLGKIAGVSTPIIDSIIIIWKSVLEGKLENGRDLDNLGLKNMDKDALIQLVMEG